MLFGSQTRGGVKSRFDRVTSRRELLKGSLLAGGALLLGLEESAGQSSATSRHSISVEEPFARGRKLGVLEFANEAPVPMDRAFGAELDCRLYTDLSKLTPKNAVTPVRDFYIRTAASQLLSEANLSCVKVEGLVRHTKSLNVDELMKQAKPMGLHIMECAGNDRAVHFGLMSLAEWTGVPLAPIVESADPAQNASRVLVAGFDKYANTSRTSLPGASWIFTLDELKSAGAFLATEMNREPLSTDHGAPIRLVVPGWYGCACIKWVNEIRAVADDAAATSQMQEYAARTMQTDVPQLARDYQPAIVDPAAIPIRIEKWVIDGKIVYRVVGISWGGRRPAEALEIRFNPEEDYAPVASFQPNRTGSWSFWTQSWRPRQTGSYMIRLQVKTKGERTRRMDIGYYLRIVDITEI